VAYWGGIRGHTPYTNLHVFWQRILTSVIINKPATVWTSEKPYTSVWRLPTRTSAILAFSGDKSCCASGRFTECRAGSDHRLCLGRRTDAAMVLISDIASCNQPTATHRSFSLSRHTRLATTTRSHDTHTYIHTPSSEKKWYICFSIYFSQFSDKFYETFSEYS